MNRYLASGLGMTLGLLASTSRADDVIWRAAGDRNPRSVPVSPAPAIGSSAQQIVQPVNLGSTTSPTPNITWVRARAQSDDAPVLPPPQTVPLVPLPNQTTGPVPVGPGDGQTWLMDGSVGMFASISGGGAPRLQATGEYLFWWTKAAGGPPLLTTSPPVGPSGIPGAVPGSTVLLNAGDVGDTFRNGFRIGLVYWLDDCASYGFDGRMFFTGDRTDRFQATSNQFPNGLFRPFFIANPVVPGGPPVGEFREVVTSPGSTAGRFVAENRSQFWGAEANYRDNICCTCNCGSSFRADLLAGFRYLNLEESLTMVEDVTRLMTNPMFPDEGPGTRIVNAETFATRNNFYGGQIGTAMQYRRDRMTLDLRTSVALGTTHQRLDINGGQVRTLAPSGQVLAFQGGLFALPTNIGEFNRNVFSVVPEVGLNVGYQVTDHLRAFVGYNFLYWTNVIRPGDQIDRVLDVNNIPRFVNVPPGAIPAVFPPRPAARFNDTDFWAQGVNLGMEFRW